MSRKVLIAVAAVLVLMAGEYLLLRQLLVPKELAGIVCRATNAGLPLDPDSVRVYVHPEGQPGEIVAEGRSGRAIAAPPGTYDVRLLLQGSSDHQTVWLRAVELPEGARVFRDAEFSAGRLEVETATDNVMV